MFKLFITTDPLHRSLRKELVHSVYFHVFEVNPTRANDRASALLSPDVLPGMENPIALATSNPARTCIYVVPDAIVSTAKPVARSFMPHADFTDHLEECKAAGVQPSWIEYLAKTTHTRMSHEAAAHCMWKIAVYIRTPMRAPTTGEDAFADGASAPGSRGSAATQQRLVEIKVGEVALTPKMILQAYEASISANVAGKSAGEYVTLSLPMTGNGSGMAEGCFRQTSGSEANSAIHVLVALAATVQAPAAATQAYFNKVPDLRTLDRLFESVNKSSSAMENGYKHAFMDFSQCEQSSLAALDATSRAGAKVLTPLHPKMARFHMPSFISYGLVGSTLKTPIWYYVLPRAGGGTDAQLEQKARFAALCVKATCDLFVVTPEEVVQRLAPFVRPNSKISIEHLTDSIALREVIAKLLTLPAFMGKYRSDVSFTYPRPDAPNCGVGFKVAESCDMDRVCGASDSGDCEDFEGVTRENYLLFVELGSRSLEELYRLVPEADRRAIIQCVHVLGRYLQLHFEYLSVAGSTTAAFPGVNLQTEILSFDQEAAINDLRSNAPRAGHSQNLVTLRRMCYGSKEDWDADLGFHQYSLLIPSIQLADYVERGLDAQCPSTAMQELTRSIVRDDRAALLDYYKARAAASRVNLPSITGEGASAANVSTIPPTVCLESTFPVSSHMVGVSIFTPSSHPRSKNIIEADVAAFRDAPRLRRLTQNYSAGSSDVIAQCHDLHAMRIVAGHVNPSTGAVDVFREDRRRWSTAFYRHICHSVNVTMLDVLRSTTQMSTTRAGCLSYSTWINGQHHRFGVPLEDAVIGSLDKAHSAAPNHTHYVVHPFLRVDTAVRLEQERAIRSAEAVSLFPPVCFGTTSNLGSDLADIYTVVAVTESAKAPDVAKTTLAERILNTRILMLDGATAAQEGQVVGHFMAELGGNLTPLVKQHLKLFRVFGDRCAFFSVRRQ